MQGWNRWQATLASAVLTLSPLWCANGPTIVIVAPLGRLHGLPGSDTRLAIPLAPTPDQLEAIAPAGATWLLLEPGAGVGGAGRPHARLGMGLVWCRTMWTLGAGCAVLIGEESEEPTGRGVYVGSRGRPAQSSFWLQEASQSWVLLYMLFMSKCVQVV